jgi:alpha-mannosidase
VLDQRLLLPESLYTLDRSARSEELVPSTIESTYTFASDLPLVPIQISVHNQSKDHRLRIGFRPFEIESILARDVSGWVERPLQKPEEWRCTYSHPHSGWLLIKGQKGQCLALYALGLREYELADDGTLYLTLLRCVDWLSRSDLSSRRYPAGPAVYVPGAQMLGQWQFRLAVGLQNSPEECETQFKRWATGPLVYQDLEALLGLKIGQADPGCAGLPRQS